VDCGADINHVTDKGDNILSVYLYWADPPSPEYIMTILRLGFNPDLLSPADYEKIEPFLK